MTKRIRIIFLIALTYFFIIIPVRSEQQAGRQQNIEENNSGSQTTGENLGEITQEKTTNDIGQSIEIEEKFFGSNNLPEATENVSENDFNDDTNGQNTQINQNPQIIISEVFYDGTEEWIEITNLGPDFSGDLQLQFPSLVNFLLNIGAKDIVIVSKSSMSYSGVSPLVRKISTPTSFSITDTKAIDIGLFRSGQELDRFYAETGIVLKFDNKKTSLTKQFINQIWIITGSNSAIHILSPYVASPGFFDFSGIFLPGDQDQGIGGSGSIFSGDSGSSTGSDLGGGGMSGIVDTPTPSSPQPDTFSITEIFNGTSQFSSFIEIKTHQNFDGKIFLTGSLLKSALELDISLEKNEYLIIVQIDNGWLSDQKKIEKPSLELKTGGFLYLLGQSGQVFDIIQILSMSGNKSNYNGPFSNGDIDIFSKIDNFSPGFDEKYLVYSNILFQVNTGQNNQNSGFSDQIGSGGLSTGSIQNGQDLSGTIASGYIMKPKDLQITSLTHLNPESITIKSNLNFSIDLSKKDRYLLTKETLTGDRKSTKKYLTGILFSGQSTTIFKTRGFLDKGSCVGLFFQTGQLDERCYRSALAKPQEEREPELEDNIPDIQILGVLPNPKGKDDKEELHLLRTTSVIANSQSDISVFCLSEGNEENKNCSLILPSKSLYLKINTTKKYLSDSLTPNQTTILTGSLGLVNKEACIELWYKTYLLDTFCYPDPLEGEFIPRGGRPEISEYIPSIKILSILPNPKGKDDNELISLLRNGNSLSSSTSLEEQKPTSEQSKTVSVFCLSEGNEENKNCSLNLTSNIQNLTLENKSLYLLHNTTKKYLSGSLKSNEETIFTGSLGFPNKAHCFELRYKQKQLDRFCYPNPKEDEYFGTGNYILQTIQKSDFNILQKVGFTVTGSKICVSYYDQFLTCRSLPASKTSIKLKNENKLYKIYFSLFQNYLMKDRSTLYYNTDIKIYFDTFKQAKSEVSKFGRIISISGQQFNAYDLSGQIQLTTVSQGLSSKQSQEQLSWRNRFILRLGL